MLNKKGDESTIRISWEAVGLVVLLILIVVVVKGCSQVAAVIFGTVDPRVEGPIADLAHELSALPEGDTRRFPFSVNAEGESVYELYLYPACTKERTTNCKQKFSAVCAEPASYAQSKSKATCADIIYGKVREFDRIEGTFAKGTALELHKDEDGFVSLKEMPSGTT
ncbi:TPA: hypothetical protein HA361_02665 [Candidatus Woesearchaeota archaeon]|nr:hypothetical protein [Candidatus Woesearchaeota archaeon]HII69422.1 hypothetical protein [Candidatus Woesearchaeota archaeon]